MFDVRMRGTPYLQWKICMSTRNILTMVSVILMSLLSACCNSGQSGASSTNKPGASTVASSGGERGEVLTVEPANRQPCDSKGPVVAVVRWKSKRPHVKIMETNPGEPTRLFSGGGFAGQATTGAWVVAETQFALVDAISGRTLATATIDRSPCTQ